MQRWTSAVCPLSLSLDGIQLKSTIYERTGGYYITSETIKRNGHYNVLDDWNFSSLRMATDEESYLVNVPSTTL